MVKNERVWSEENIKDVTKGLFDKEISQLSQQKPRASVQDNGRGVTSACGRIRCPSFLSSPSRTIIWYLSIDKNVFVVTMMFSTICRGTTEESCPPVHSVIGRQT